MDKPLREEIYNQISPMDTEDLLEIWEEDDVSDWTEGSFEIIEGLLLKRLGYVPLRPARVETNEVLIQADRFLQAGQLDQAMQACETAIRKMPDNALAYNYRGLIHEEMEQLEKAIADYQKAVHLYPELEDAWDNLKAVEMDLEQEFLRSATKQHLDQALDFAYADEPRKALEECNKARQGMPGIAAAHNYLGLILEELEQVGPAQDAYREAVRRNPRYYAARENLANARLRLEEQQYRQAATENQGATGAGTEWRSVVDWDTAGSAEEGDPIPARYYLDERAFLLSGWPGHRTRPWRSGYDPLDTDFELAHAEGVIIRRMLDRNFRTHNPVYLFLLAVVGLILCLPLFIGAMAFLQGHPDALTLLLIYSPHWLIGTATIVNVFLSLVTQKPAGQADHGSEFF